MSHTAAEIEPMPNDDLIFNAMLGLTRPAWACLTKTVWKDGIDIEFPNEGCKRFVGQITEPYRVRIAALTQALDVLHRRIETLIGVICPRCENGDKLFVEPETGFYTHCLGGNYCSAHKLHSLLDTEASQKARAALAAGPRGEEK